VSLEVKVLRAVDEETAASRGPCALCGTEYVLGPVFAWVNTDGGPEDLCERCLRGLCGFARSEGLEVPWKDAWEVYVDARQRFPEPLSTVAEMLSLPLEEQGRILDVAHLT